MFDDSWSVVLRAVFLGFALIGASGQDVAGGPETEGPTAQVPVSLGSRSVFDVLEEFGRAEGIRFCFEISMGRGDWLYGARKWVATDGSNLEAILKEVGADGFDFVRREGVTLVVDRALGDLKHNPLDSRIQDFHYRGPLNRLEIALIDKAKGFAPLTGDIERGGPMKEIELRVDGASSVREVLLQAATRFGSRWTASIKDVALGAKVPIRDLEGNVLGSITEFNLHFVHIMPPAGSEKGP